jgi:hypothetical protein
MNLYEFGLFVVAAMLLATYLYWKFRSPRMVLLLLGLSLLPLYLSIERCSQFLTVDEAYIIDEPLYISVSEDLTQWSYSALRTTDVVFGILAGIHHKFFPSLTDVWVKIVFKNLHWLLGFTILLAIHYLLSNHLVSRDNEKPFFVAFTYTALLLPTNALAQRIFTYDKLSMLLGVLAILCIYVSFKTNSVRYAFAAIVISYLAAQEKLAASPILILSLATFGCMLADSNRFRHRHLAMFWGLLVGIGMALLVGISGALLVARLRHWESLDYLLLSVFDPLVSWIRTILRFLLGVRFSGTSLWLLAPVFAATCLLAIGLVYAKRAFSKRLDVLIRTLSRANTILAMLVFLVGIVGIYTIEAYLAPWVPILPGYYHPVAEFNGTTLHFGVPTLWQHLITYIAWAYTLFVNSVPTVYWLVLGAAAAAMWVLGRAQEVEFGVELLLLVGLLMPLGFALLQIPVSARYLNIGLLLFTFAVILKGVAHLTSLSQIKRATLTSLFALILTLEVLPFGPLYIAFRPIWANYSEAHNATVTPGMLDAFWMGWGEETMLVGQQLERQCHSLRDVPEGRDSSGPLCSSIHLYTAWSGFWLDEDTEIASTIFRHTQPDEYSYTEFDYYVVNRSTVLIDLFPFPANVEPVFVISYRGYTQAWVFRGDDLQEAGFRFEER